MTVIEPIDRSETNVLQASGSSSEAATLLKLVVDSGYGYAVIEEAVAVIKRRLTSIDLQDPALVELLKATFAPLVVQRPSEKFFSFELLCRLDEKAAESVAVEVCRMLSGMDLKADRAYIMEKELLSFLGARKRLESLPLLALVASRRAGEISRAAARAAVEIVGSRRKDDLRAALEAGDLADSEPAAELAQSIVDAFNRRRRAPFEEAQVLLTEDPVRNASTGIADVPGETSTRVTVRPERRRERDNRLRAILREAGRDSEECFNCALVGPTRVGHIIPLERGGSDRVGNLTALCQQCWRRFVAHRRNSSSARRRLETISSEQIALFEPD